MIQYFLTKYPFAKFTLQNHFFSGPILCKLGTNQPFVKWISVSLNKASHSNRNYSKVQNKRGRGLKLVLDRHSMLLHSGYIGIIHCPTYFFPMTLNERGVKYTKLIWALWTIFVWFYIMVGLSFFFFVFCFFVLLKCKFV